jgi:hypothetical protein
LELENKGFCAILGSKKAALPSVFVRRGDHDTRRGDTADTWIRVEKLVLLLKA